MSLRVLVVCALAAGCGDPETTLPEGVSCQQLYWLNERGPPPMLDVVIAVSDAATMAPYRDRLLANLETFGWAIADGGYDVHVALVDVSGLTAGDDACGDGPVVPYFKDWELPWWSCPDGACGQRNYEGDLGVRLACAAPPSNQPTAPPLIQRVANVVDEPGFGRPDAMLGIVIVGLDDDASPQPLAVYLDRIRRSRTDPANIRIATVNGPGAARLGELRNAFDGSVTVPIDDVDWSDVMELSQHKENLGISCLDGENIVDLDDKRPGIQPHCVVFEDGAEVPRCRMATPDLPDPEVLPCWWVEITSFGCSAPTVEREQLRPLDELTMSCACEL